MFFRLPPCFCSAVFSWEEAFGWLSTAYVRLSANMSLQSPASCCHSSHCAHQLNPLSCGWAGRQVSGQHLSLQLSVFPSVPSPPHAHISLHHSPTCRNWKNIQAFFLRCISAQKFFKSKQTCRHTAVSSQEHLLVCHAAKCMWMWTTVLHRCSIPCFTFSTCQSQL